MKVSKNMADSERIKEIVNQAAIQVAMVVMMESRDIDAGPPTSHMATHKGVQKQAWHTST